MHRLVIESAAIGVLTGSMVAGISMRAGQGNAWVAVAAIMVALVGALGIAFACRGGATAVVRAKRIVALVLLGLLVPVLGLVAGWAAQWGAWGMWTAIVLVFLSALFGLSRLTPMNINHWVAAEEMPPNTSLERTREG